MILAASKWEGHGGQSELGNAEEIALIEAKRE